MTQSPIPESLAQLTAGWKTGPADAPASLDNARKALAASLVLGMKSSSIHPALETLPPSSPSAELITGLQALIAGASELADPVDFGVVRSSAAVDPNNPSGLAASVRGMRVQQTFGPFIDAGGALHFVDIFARIRQASIAFGSATGIFGSFPVITSSIEPPTVLILGAGSVWFTSKLLVSALPAGSFSGFRISSGRLTASVPFQRNGDVFVLPTSATVKLSATLESPALPSGGSGIGKDSEADTVQLPKTASIVFKQSAATVATLDASSTTVYGTAVELTRNAEAPIAFNNNTAVLIPCTPSIPSFTFASVASTQFVPSGSAEIVGAGWVLPVAQSTVASLGEAAGAGSLLIGMGTGTSAHWQLHPTIVPIAGIQLFVDPTQIIFLAGGVSPASVLTSFRLWPEQPPSTRHTSIDFITPAEFVITFVSTPGTETLIGLGLARAHLDRPLAADGHRYAFTAPASIGITTKSTGTQVTLLARQATPSAAIQPLALENALIGTRLPYGLLLIGEISGTNFTRCGVSLFFVADWILPTLADPYAATFGLGFIRQQQPSGLSAIALWPGANDVALTFAIGPTPATAAGVSNSGATSGSELRGTLSLFSSNTIADPRAFSTRTGFTALLDLSTRVDLFGVAIVPNLAGRGNQTNNDQPVGKTELPGGAASSPVPAVAAAARTPAPAVGVVGLSLAVNGATCATFALPQVSWEPMESAQLPSGPIFCNPPSDGPPLLLAAPDQQQLVPVAPSVVLLNQIGNVVAGKSFSAQFSLPFGLVAHIRQPNRPPARFNRKSLFISEGGQFHVNAPTFPGSVAGALQLTLKPPFPERPDAMFSGSTTIDTTGGTSPNSGYGYDVLGSSTGIIFNNEFNTGMFRAGVPLRRIDLAGYGASIFSEWADNHSSGPHVTKVDFNTVIGRTAFEVVQVVTVLYPYCVNVVRTVIMQRQGAGWIRRTDSGWQPSSDGLFTFPNAADFANRVHRGAVAGVFNVRNIREVEEFVFVPPGSPSPPGFEFKKVLFDADIGLDHRVTVLQGGSATTRKDADGNSVTLSPARDLIGYIQLGPDGVSPNAVDLQGLFQQTGPISAAFSCVAQIGSLGATTGTSLRCSAIEIDMPTVSTGSTPVPAVAAALRSAPVLPRDGAWGFGQRASNAPSPTPLAHDFPVPITQPTTDANTWHIADIADVLRLDDPANLYGILQDTGTQKLLFEKPTVPILGAASPPGSTPGISLPNPPNFADVASLLSATGLFPDISNTISLLSGAADQLQNVGDSLKYSKSVTFDPQKAAQVLLDLGVIQLALSYADESKGRDAGGNAKAPTKLTYTLDPAAAKRWSFEIDNLSFLVVVPEFSSDPLLTIVGGLVADDQTAPTLSNLNIVYGSALDSLKSIFSKLQTLAQFLPGGVGAGLNISLSNGRLTVTDTFTLPTLPLGLGELTDIGIDLGLAITLSPLSADFLVGVGGPDNPFNWIVSPLAGNGLINVGVKDGKPDLIVQGGIGLGLAIDLAIASGSASITIAVKLDISPPALTVIFILNGQASVDVLGGLASASITLTASVGVTVNPLPIPVPLLLPEPGFDFPAEDITFLASVSVGIHISICWVVNVDFDGSWQFSQSIHTPELRVVA
jgi:hypothetical protein